MSGRLDARMERADRSSVLPTAATSCHAASIRASSASQVSRCQ